MKSIFLWLGGSVAAVLIAVRSLFVITVRLREQHGVILLDLINKRGRKFVLRTEWYNGDFPKEMSAVCFIERIFMLYRTEERMLRAGFKGTDLVVRVTLFRWNFSKFIKVLEENTLTTDGEVNVFLAQTWQAEKIGSITVPPYLENPYLVSEKYKDVEEDISRVLFGDMKKTGVILYGGPGNGKTYLVRYFAIRFKLPVYLIAFKPDYDNHDIIRIFSHIKAPAIILFEDFDSYFEGRECRLEGAKFTFDAILNVLDGIFSENKGIITCMTVNDIEKVDIALKARPSRFKFVKHIDDPPYEVRKRILGDELLVKENAGRSLDELLILESRSVGLTVPDKEGRKDKE